MSFTTKLNGGLDFANKGTEHMEHMKHKIGDKQQATERAVAWKQDSMKQKRQVMKISLEHCLTLLPRQQPIDYDTVKMSTAGREALFDEQSHFFPKRAPPCQCSTVNKESCRESATTGEHFHDDSS
jgi:hypothetical protein